MESRTDEAVLATSVQPEPLWFIDHLVHVHIDADASNGQLAIVEERGRRGDMPPLHVHGRDDETFYVIEGELSLFAAGRQLPVTAGQAALAAREVPHTYRVESEEARWLVITTPAGFESFVRRVAEPAPGEELPEAGRAVDPAFLAQAAADVGIEILGPPGALPAA